MESFTTPLPMPVLAGLWLRPAGQEHSRAQQSAFGSHLSGPHSGRTDLVPHLPVGGRAVKRRWKLVRHHLAGFGIRPELVRLRAGLFHQIMMKYLVGFCFPSGLLSGTLKGCGKRQVFALTPVPQVCAFLCPQSVPRSERSSVLAVRSQAGLSGKGKSSALGRAHLTFASTGLCSPLGGSVGSAAKQSAGCHEQDLPA